MDIFRAHEEYFTNIFSSNKGMSILLLDQDTTPIVSAVFSQSALLSDEIYLVDQIEKQERERLRYLHCIAFLRPSQSTIKFLCNELENPRYGGYSLFFSNIVQKSQLERIAEADASELVKSVQEHYADSISIDSILFSLNLSPPKYGVFANVLDTWDPASLQQSTSSLLAVLLALKKKPRIRFEANSAMSRILATEIHFHMQQEKNLFDFRRPDTPPVLLILDRRNDPVTPLLSQWTYQAMVHELLSIQNGRVDLSHVPGVSNELKEIVLSASQDQFYGKNMYSNFGDLGANVREFVSVYQSKTKDNKSIQTINDMKRFVEEYPEFKKLSGSVSKHVALIGELSRLVEKERLLEVSEIEQSLACNEIQSNDLQAVKNVLESQVSDHTKLKLLALYALRYEKVSNNAIAPLKELLQAQTGNPRIGELINTLLRYAGESSRLEELYVGNDFFSRAKSGIKGLKGVENVYTQHQPILSTTLRNLARNKLSDRHYQYIDGFGSTGERPQDIIVFFVGGATYEEARACYDFHQSNPGVRVVLGGTDILNSLKFLKQVASLSSKK